MNKFISAVKALRLKQVLTVFFAGLLLLLNTACNNAPTEAKLDPAKLRLTDQGKVTDRGPNPVGQNQPYSGGMNNFDDTAPGAAMKGTADKTKALINNAQRNIEEKDPRNAELYKDPAKAVDRTADKLGTDIKIRANNAKEEAKNVGSRVAGSGERAASKTKELGERIQQGAENVKDNVTDATDNAGYQSNQATTSIKDKVAGAAKAVKDAIDD